MSLAQQLQANHYKNVNGCWLTDYSKIPGLRILAATTNGTSGLAQWKGRKIYFYQSQNTFYVEPY